MYVSRHIVRFAALLLILPFEYCKDITTNADNNRALPGQIFHIARFSIVLPFGANAQELPLDIKDLVLYVDGRHIDTLKDVSHYRKETCETLSNKKSYLINQ